MPIHSQSDLVVEICRAASEQALELLIGATAQFWKTQGFGRVAVTYTSPAAGIYGATVRMNPGGGPETLGHDLTNQYTAVVVLSGE
ncbi:hypothetical protein FPZ24_01915 [Sphingomonas panacisoli]|uniref:Uncharacterized protein n=1 Tax=Sphingomonas panacisoli TaxID=1813879 RepID=A0A5B8LGV9_9SPHN|nr:hypothetical protein FPZ24_01915 [Sphingomonas panacisoli]